MYRQNYSDELAAWKAKYKPETVKAKANPDLPKRPLNGFLRFCEDRRREAKSGEGEEGRSSSGKMLKATELSLRWKKLPEDERARYNNDAAEAYALWSAEYLPEKRAK